MSSRSPSPRHGSYPERRKSISLSPIRTESGANLRTANWTKMRFRAPGESRGAFQASNWNQRNYNNYNNNYNNYNNYRGNFNPRGRWQNRGRGNYRGNWNRGGGYVPKRRNYSRNYGSRSRSRSRSYSRSRSRSRSYSAERRRSFSRSRSRSYSRSRSRSHGSPHRESIHKTPPKMQEKPAAKSEAMSYFGNEEEISKKTLEPGKIGISKWDSPDKKYGDDVQIEQKSGFSFQSSEKHSSKPTMEFKSFPTYEQTSGANGQGDEEGHSAAQVQQMMEKTALASVARHEKSLMKIRKAQGKIKKLNKSDSSDDNLDENEILQMMKSVKKAKKKKNKSKLGKKMTKAKLKKMKLAAPSSSSDSDDKSSDNSASDSSSPEMLKKKALSMSRKKKHAKIKAGSISPQSKKMRHNEEANMMGSYGGEIRKDMPMQSGVPLMQQTIQQAPGNQPVMLMAPNLGDMRLLGTNGQPLNVIQLAVPGPDGKMQILQIPSMGQEGQQPIVMIPPTAMQQPHQAVGQQQVLSYPTSMASVVPTPPAPVPKPVPPPAPPGEPPMSSQPSSQILYDDDKMSNNQTEKELSEKQKRRKEVIRTRLWPRPAKTTWDEETENSKQETENAPGNGNRPQSWGQSKDSKADGKMSYEYSSGSKDTYRRSQDKNGGNNIPGFSPENKHEGQKIPTLTRGSMPQQSVESVKETIDELPRKKHESVNPVSHASTGMTKCSDASSYNQPQLVAYPSHITQSSYEPVYVGSQATASASAAQGTSLQQKESKWTTATEDFIRERQPQKKSKYDEPGESSSDEDFTTALITKKPKKKNYEAQMIEMQEEVSYQDEDMKKGKKKKKNKKERKDSYGTEEATSPHVKEKKRKKKKKNKDKDYENTSDAEMKKLKKQEKKHDKAEDDDLVRHIPSDLPLSHIRGLVVRQDDEGNQSIFEHIDFSKLASESEFAEEKDSYEDQFVSLFGSTSEESKPAKKISPLNMSKKALKKVKVTPDGPRTVAHMTEVSLSRRIAVIWEANRAEEKKNVSQKVSVNLASLSNVDDKYEKLKSPPKSRSSSPDDRRHRSRSSSYGSESSRSRSRSARSPRSLPKAYSGDRSFDRQDNRESRSRSRSREGDRRGYRNNNRGYFQPHNRYNQRFPYRGRGNFVNYRARGRFFHRGFNNNRGYNNYNNYNNNYRGRGYYNNNNQRDQNQWRNRRQSYRSDDEERRDRRRSRSYSVSDRRSGSSASSEDERRDQRGETDHVKTAPENQEVQQPYSSGAAGQGTDGSENVKVRRKSPDQWTHDMFEEHEKEE